MGATRSGDYARNPPNECNGDYRHLKLLQSGFRHELVGQLADERSRRQPTSVRRLHSEAINESDGGSPDDTHNLGTRRHCEASEHQYRALTIISAPTEPQCEPFCELFVLMSRQCTQKVPLLKPELFRRTVPSAASRGADRPWQTDSSLYSYRNCARTDSPGRTVFMGRIIRYALFVGPLTNMIG